jgi:hypothetical protein
MMQNPVSPNQHLKPKRHGMQFPADQIIALTVVYRNSTRLYSETKGHTIVATVRSRMTSMDQSH